MRITISGPPGSGKSTVAKALAKKLKYKLYSNGYVWRKLAREKGYDISKFEKICQKNPELDKEIDKKAVDFARKEKNFVMETRVPWMIKNALKIFIDANIEERTKRIFNAKRKDEDYQSFQDGLKKIIKRENQDAKRLEKLYGKNYLDRHNYDFIIDTTHLTVQQTVEKIQELIKNFS